MGSLASMYFIDQCNDIISKAQNLFMPQPICIMLIALDMIKLSRGKASLCLARNTKRTVEEAAECLTSAIPGAFLCSLQSRKEVESHVWTLVSRKCLGVGSWAGSYTNIVNVRKLTAFI